MDDGRQSSFLGGDPTPSGLTFFGDNSQGRPSLTRANPGLRDPIPLGLLKFTDLKPLFRNPEGIVSFSPGLRGTSYPGKTCKKKRNPEGVAAKALLGSHSTPSGLAFFGDYSQGSSSPTRANPGLRDPIPLGLKN